MPKIVFDEDAEIVVPEPTKQPDVNIHEAESSDDEAPEAISTSKAKETLISKAHAEKEAAAKVAAAEKEKRRQKDLLLKTQKEGSKRQQKELEKKKANKEQEEQQKEPNLLPDDLLQQALQEQEEDKRKRHMTAEDFERMIAEQEEEEKERAKKRKTVHQGKQVGEYTVKVLNQRPRLQKANKVLLNARHQTLHRKSVPRKEAVVNISSGREGAALVFRRK
ncbi:uncharacterized protein B0P05DRAFT_526112 [Gilbertella persicaria]|uniref:uncharacterized protein n=1 Tax=Gilbertella persicaria TaxID=101096 RepID=UPI00221E408F|nr:uncharacterized protein B0P05DRAFT_526112 [Gilbertella persicaria]KAI8092400.1 hypothetical protein B0P05DRAFT_526112 [Gilbertella persicaria]